MYKVALGIIKGFAIFTIVLSAYGENMPQPLPPTPPQAPAPHNAAIIAQIEKGNETGTIPLKPSTPNLKKQEPIPIQNKKKKDKTEKKTQQKIDYQEVSDSELQQIIDGLAESDKKIIQDLQNQISNWPESVFREVRDYNEFMMVVSKKAQENYYKLSNGAKQALDAEEELKKKLSSDAVNKLAKLHVHD